MEAIILAGGLGTRLKSVVHDLPKAMASISGKPFLTYQFKYLKEQGIQKFVLAVGYKHEFIMQYYGNEFEGVPIEYSIEDEPLGTGGAIKKALNLCQEENVLVVNGDTMMLVDIKEMLNFHILKSSKITLCLKELSNFDRYGTLVVDSKYNITAFQEKKPTVQGQINSGVYWINRQWLMQATNEEKFSFEHEILEKFVDEGSFFGFMSDGYFIDIGIPEDFHKAQVDFGVLFYR